MEKETRYTMKEIEMATGIPSTTLCSRRRARGIPVNSEGYTIQEVKSMLKKRRGGGRYNPKKADALKTMLKNDGAI